MWLLTYLRNFVSLFYPALCMACRKSLAGGETLICTECLFYLPYTGFHEDPENRMARQLWGRVPFVSAAAYLHFRKGSRVQHLVHQLKYRNQPGVGVKLGTLYGNQLANSPPFKQADLVLPVPLHPSKQRRRGYNQSASFAEGLSQTMQITLCTNNLIRIAKRETQTRKSRFLRYENMQEVFSVREPGKLTGKHLILADDVLTTGATIEACCKELLKIPGTTISIVTIAFAE